VRLNLRYLHIPRYARFISDQIFDIGFMNKTFSPVKCTPRFVLTLIPRIHYAKSVSRENPFNRDIERDRVAIVFRLRDNNLRTESAHVCVFAKGFVV